MCMQYEVKLLLLKYYFRCFHSLSYSYFPFPFSSVGTRPALLTHLQGMGGTVAHAPRVVCTPPPSNQINAPTTPTQACSYTIEEMVYFDRILLLFLTHSLLLVLIIFFIFFLLFPTVRSKQHAKIQFVSSIQ